MLVGRVLADSALSACVASAESSWEMRSTTIVERGRPGVLRSQKAPGSSHGRYDGRVSVMSSVPFAVRVTSQSSVTPSSFNAFDRSVTVAPATVTSSSHRLTGAFYKASGWIHVGTTQGHGRYDRHTRRDQPKKDVWIRPLRKDWRRTLNR